MEEAPGKEAPSLGWKKDGQSPEGLIPLTLQCLGLWLCLSASVSFSVGVSAAAPEYVTVCAVGLWDLGLCEPFSEPAFPPRLFCLFLNHSDLASPQQGSSLSHP